MGRNFTAERPDQLWVADITYVPTAAGFLYLAIVLDVWSRRIIGWAMGNTLHTSLIMDAFNMAVAARRPEGVVHHRDRGSQLGLNRSSQHHPELTAALRREPQQASSIPVSSEACC